MGTPRYQYQGTPLVPPPVSLAIASGAVTNAKAGTYYFWLQYRNRAGYSLVSPVVSIAIAPSQGVTITIPAAARPTPNGSYIFKYVILASDTSDPTNASVVATQPGYAADGITALDPPFQITLNQDEHFELGKIVATPANLPTSGLRNGMRRSVDSISQVVEFNSTTNSWDAVFPPEFNTYVATSDGLKGANQDIAEISDRSIIIYPDYAMQPDEVATPVTFWIANVGSTPINKGTRIGLTVQLGGIDISGMSGIIGGVQLAFLGYANITNGQLDTSGAGGAGTMPAIGEYVEYPGPETGFLVPKDIPPGFAYILAISAAIDPVMLNNGAPQGSTLDFSPFFYSSTATYNPLADLAGDFIAPKFKRRRIVPGLGLSAIALNGSGTLTMPRGGGFSFYDIGDDEVVGLEPATDNQKVVLNASGTCIVSDTIPETGELRAIVGTVDGVGAPTDWEGPIAITNLKTIQVNVTYPLNIRSNYPDVIAGSPDGTFNATYVVIYVRPVGGGTVTRWQFLVTIGSTSGTFIVGAQAGTDIGSGPLPTPSDPAFGLYAPTNESFTAVAINSAGVFEDTEDLEVAIAFSYVSTVTKISHSTTLGCIPEAGGTIVDALEGLKSWAPPVADLDAMRSLDTGEVFGGQARYVSSRNKPYYYSLTSTATDDGTATSSAVRLNGVDPGSPGRFLIDNSSAWFTVNGVPGSSFAEVGDFAIDVDLTSPTVGNVYEKTGTTTWSFRFRMRFNSKGEWSEFDSYIIDDLVALDGVLYLAIAPSTNQSPPNLTYWRELIRVFVNRGNWDIFAVYFKGDYVTRNGSFYQSLQYHTGVAPETDDPLTPVYWRLAVSKGDQGIQGIQGIQGETGPPGVVTATSGVQLVELMTPPSTASGEINLFNLEDKLRWRRESDGAIAIPMTAGRQTIFIPASAISPRLNNGCAPLATAQASLPNRPNVRHIAFSGSSNQFGQFEIDMPKSWNLSSLVAQFVWTALVNEAGTVIWGIQAVAQSDDDTIDTAYGTAVTTSDTFIDIYDRHISPETTPFIVEGTPAIGDSVCFQIFRDAATDTRTEAANLLGVRLYFVTDKENDD